MTRQLPHFCIVGVKRRRVAASDAFYVAEIYAVMPHSHNQKARVVIYLHLSDQHLTNSLFFNWSNITSVSIHVGYYNNNWVISL